MKVCCIKEFFDKELLNILNINNNREYSTSYIINLIVNKSTKQNNNKKIIILLPNYIETYFKLKSSSPININKLKDLIESKIIKKDVSFFKKYVVFNKELPFTINELVINIY